MEGCLGSRTPRRKVLRHLQTRTKLVTITLSATKATSLSAACAEANVTFEKRLTVASNAQGRMSHPIRRLQQ